MSKFFALTKVLLMTGTNSFAKNKNRKLRGIFLYILLALAFTPLAIGIGGIASAIYDALAMINQQGMVLMLAYTVSSMLILVFGIFYVLSTFYFSKDIENLLPLPLNPMQILSSKFLVTLIYEYLTELVFLLPIIIAYGVKSSSGIVYYILSIIFFLTIPIVPLVAASILSMIIMRFTNIGKNKDRFKVVSGVLLMFLIFGFNTYINRITSSNTSVSKIQSLLKQGNNSLINVTTTTFINAKLAALTMVNLGNMKSVINLILYFIVTAGLFMIFLLLAQGLYFKGVIGLNQTATKHKQLSSVELDKGTEASSVLNALVKKEIRLLFRTPVYFMNCIMMNFLWPIFILIPILTQPESLKGIRSVNANLSYGGISNIIVAIAFAVSVFVTSSNCITPTAISREGQNLFVMKFIPVSFKKQITAKLLSGIIMGAVGTAVMIITAGILFRPNAALILNIILVCVFGIAFICETGLILDLYFPKLIWDNEQRAVKQNMNVLLNMVIGIVFAGLTVLLVIFLRLKLLSVTLSIMIIYGVMDFLLYRFLMNTGVNRLMKLEN